MKSSRFLGFALCGMLFALGVSEVRAASGTWSDTGGMTGTRSQHTATLLPNGKVLVAGGGNSSSFALASAELYDPATGTWSATGSMTANRVGHAATLLPNGKVLITGGVSGETFASAELFDPATGTWSATGSMTANRVNHTATLLPNGSVLVAGGMNVIPGCCYLNFWSSAELYDPAAGTWSATGSMSVPRSGHTATLLPNGKVLAAGGSDCCRYWATAEVYDSTTGTWSATGSMTAHHSSHTATLLPNGKVLAVGGSSCCTILATAEVYDSTTGTWSATGSMSVPRIDHTTTLLPDGSLLVAGGRNSSSLASAELYDSATGTWSATGSMTAKRHAHTATLLPNGKVLVAGGYTGSTFLSSAELYASAAPPSLTAITVTPSDPSINVGQTQQFTASGSFTDGSSRVLSSSSWATKAPLPTSRWASTVGAINGKIIVAGGYNGSHITTVETYDTSTNTWATKNPKPSTQTNAANGVIGGVLYAAGGTNCCVEINDLWAYNPANDVWTSKAPLPGVRQSAAGGVIDGRFHVVGGHAFSQSLALHHVYDPVANAWTTRAPVPTARTLLSVGVVNGTLYAVGGLAIASNTALATVEAYDPLTNTWTAKASMLTARFGVRVDVVNGILYAAGGRNSSGAVSTVEAYDPLTNTWSAAASMPTARDSFGASVVNGVLYAIGGVGSSGGLAANEAFTPGDGLTWSSNNTAVATIDGGGLSTGASHGTTTITAISGSVSGSTMLTVANPNQPPVADAGPDQVIEATSPAGAYALLDGTGSSDPDGDALGYQWSGSFGTASGATTTVALGFGVHTITLGVSDGQAGDNDTVQVAVVDTTAPALALPADLTVEATGAAGATLHYVASATDMADPAPALGCTPASGSTFALGTTPVDCTATDVFGNVRSGSFDVTVVDTTAPVVTVPDPITVFAAYPDEAQVFYDASATDRVDLAPSLLCTPFSGATFGLGPNTVFCSAADAAGNGSTASFTVTVIDSGAPVLSVPGDLRVSASSAAGAVVIYAVSATDGWDADPVVTCTPASGTTFALGSTLVTCEAEDDSGNGASASFTVTVVDDGAPALTVPADITVNATSPAGAVVTFAASASDTVDAGTTVSCTPPSGSTFAAGNTVVTCSATDASGNSAVASFSVTVIGSEQQIDNALALVDSYALPAGTEGSLSAKLDSAAASLEAGNTTAACNQVKAFLNEVKAQAGKALTRQQADALLAAARQIQAAMGC